MQMVAYKLIRKRVEFLNQKCSQNCKERERLIEEKTEILTRLDTINSQLLLLSDKIRSLDSAQMDMIHIWQDF